MRPLVVRLALVGSGVLSGCNLSPEECDFYRLEARMVGTVERGGQSAPIDFVDAAYAFQSWRFESMHAFDQSRAFLTEGRVAYGSSVAWSVGTSSEPYALSVGLLLRGPRQVGDLVEVGTGSISLGTGRGPATNSLPADAQIGIGSTDFEASLEAGGSVGGTVTILGVTPLWLGLDVLATAADAEEMWVRGEMTFRALGNSIGCD